MSSPLKVRMSMTDTRRSGDLLHNYIFKKVEKYGNLAFFVLLGI